MEDLEIYINIDVMNTPCELLDMRFTSIKGRKHTIERRVLTKENTGPFGIPMEKTSEMLPGRTLEEISKAIDNGESCRIMGVFYLHFLSNNFHITYSNPMVLSRLVQMRGGNYVFQLSHIINSLFIGKQGIARDYA